MVWGIFKTIWDAIGHIGNVQTLWDMISGAVQYWPTILRGSVWVITSWWLPLIASMACLLSWRFLAKTSKESKNSSSIAKDQPDQKLQIACGPHIEGSVAQAWWTINGEPLPVNFFRVVVNATQDSQLVKNCTGFLTRIEKGRKTKWGGNNAQLTFAPAEKPDALSKTIRYPVAEYLDVLEVTSRNQVFPGTKPTIGLRLWPFVPAMDEIFSELGDYLLSVAITGKGVVPSITTLLKFNWTGNWETSSLSLATEAIGSNSLPSPQQETPLTGIRLRKECDKWIESGKALRERLVVEGKGAIPQAKQWIQEFETFAELNLSVSDFDAVNAVTHEDKFNREMTEVDPSQEAKAYQRLVGHRYGHLLIIRNKIK